MSQRLQDGRWFDVKTEAQHTYLKRYGELKPPEPASGSYRVQYGKWSGPGKYLFLTYWQRCPRNCCDDSVGEVLSAQEVIEQTREEMRELAQVLKTAKGLE